MDANVLKYFPSVEAAGQFWAGVIGLWCMFGVINLGVASLKGRKLLFWTFMGLIFGPFGFIALLLQKTPRSGAPTSASAAPRTPKAK